MGWLSSKGSKLKQQTSRDRGTILMKRVGKYNQFKINLRSVDPSYHLINIWDQ